VFFTALTIEIAAQYFILGFSRQLALVLGTIVNKPDAVTSTNLTKGLA